MAGRSTWLAVGVVAVVGAVAVADSLRGESASRPERQPDASSTPATTGRDSTQTGEDASPSFGGTLYYTDESCELRAVELPTLEPADAPGWDECRFVLSPEADRASGAGSGWDTYSDPRIGRLFQTAAGRIEVSSNLGPEGEPVRGTAAAWRPNGTLTYVAGGALREWPSGETVLTQNDLAVAVRAHPGVPDAGRVREVVVEAVGWLDDSRLVTALSVPVEDSVEHVVAVFEGHRLAWVDVAGPAALSDVRVSAGGRFFAVRTGSGFVLFDSRRGPVETPAQIGSDVHALAWSPDEQWVAAAAASSVYVFRPGDQARVRELPIAAADLAWRGPAGATVLAAPDRAREWLGDQGATGRLFVTEPGCRLRALRLPDLTWEDEPDRGPAPCRFTLGAGEDALAETTAVAPGGQLRATCRDGRLAVFGPQGRSADIPDACAPAWTPDGTLTFLREGELWRGMFAPRRLVSRAELRAMFGREATLEEVAWLDDRRVWAVVRLGSAAAIASMTLSRLVYSPTFGAARIEGLRVNRAGMVAARTEQGVVIFDNGGRRALTYPGATAVAWAPDSLVAAVATEGEVLFVAPVSRDVVAVPLEVRDLEWVVP